MKRRFLSLLIGVGMVALIFPLFSGNRAARLAESYPLVCRGSESFKLDPPTKCEGCTNVETEEPRARYVAFTFIRGSKPSGKGLAPGECSWLDRGMWADEPDRIVQEIEGVGVDEKYAWIKELHSPASYWTFNVYSSHGRLLATGSERNGKPVVSGKG